MNGFDLEFAAAKRSSGIFSGLQVTRSEQNRIANLSELASDGKTNATIAAGNQNCSFHESTDRNGVPVGRQCRCNTAARSGIFSEADRRSPPRRSCISVQRGGGPGPLKFGRVRK